MSEQTPSRGDRRAYPADEFDELEPTDGRRGAHRARPNPVLAVVPVLLVVVAVVAVVVGAMTLLGGGDSASTAAAPGPAATEPAEGGTAAPEETGAPAETSAPEASEPESSEPAATESAPAETEPPGEVDTAAEVTVLNGTTTSGLAGGATERLRGEGWTVPVADNYRGEETYPTTVFYPDEELAATAEAVAEDLGGAQTQLSDEFDVLTVVLGEDYQP
jgi:hypothetical protein